MTWTLEHQTTLVAMACGECGIEFAVPGVFERARRDDHQRWYCPNGHCRVFKDKSAAEKAKERADSLAQQLASREEDLRVERASHAATKGTLTKVRNRADKGVCQHCKRSFANVQRHVAHMHPSAVA